MIFKYNQLRHFFTTLREKGETGLFRDWQGEKVFLVRHDIDFDLKLAYDVAVIEQELDVVATFFVLTTCHSYNVLSQKNREWLQKIVAMGHEVGLHFDPTLYAGNFQQHAQKEADILSFACGQEVKSISLHNPSVHGQYPMIDGFVNAYDPKYFSDENYISDSCFGFRGKDIYQFLDGIDERMIQILLHPMHYSEKGWGYDDVLVHTFKSYMEDVHNSFGINATYRAQVGDSIMDKFKEKLV